MQDTTILPILLVLIYTTNGFKAIDISTSEGSKETSYFERVTKSRNFVDKTQLLKHFLQHERRSKASKYVWDNDTRAILFTCPKGFGKTTNLDMVRKFFQVPFDKSTGQKIDKRTSHYFELFSKLEIAQDKNFVEQHFGEYPVIHVDFANIRGETTDEIITFMKKQIGQVVNSYRWLCIKTRKENENSTDQRLLQHLSNFKKIFKKTANVNDSVHALEGLAELLLQHFDKKRIMMLIDNCDIPISYTFSKKIDIKPIYDFMHFLLKKFIQYDRVACHVMIVGTSFLPFYYREWDCEDDQFWNIVKPSQFLYDSFESGQYFGFTAPEVDILMNSNNINQYEREKVKKHFGDYTFTYHKSTNHSLYHPTAVLRYLETNVIEDDRLNVNILIPLVTKCLQSRQRFTWMFQILIKKGTWFGNGYLSEHFDRWYNLTKFVQLVENNCSWSYDESYIYKAVLFDNGYMRREYSDAIISNKMAENLLIRIINQFFFHSYHINITNSYVSTSIQSIMTSRITTDEMLISLSNSLHQMMNSTTASHLSKFQFFTIISVTLLHHWDIDQYVKMREIYGWRKMNQRCNMLMLQNRLQNVALIVGIFYHTKSLQKAIDDTRRNVPNKWPFYHDYFSTIKYLAINLNKKNQFQVGMGKNCEYYEG